jgi:hypothetical protein
MEEKFDYLRGIYNENGRKRSVPLPLDFIRGEGDLEEGMIDELDENGKKTYMSLIGIIGYLATTIRFDVRFGYMI